MLSTINWRLNNTNKFFLRKSKRAKLQLSPQKKTTVIRLRICTPRKPNSARRPVIKGIMSNKFFVLAHIPGIGHSLKKHSRVLINGNRLRDVPVVNYSCVRGVYDFDGLHNKQKRRSIYGSKKPALLKIHIRRKLRLKE